MGFGDTLDNLLESRSPESVKKCGTILVTLAFLLDGAGVFLMREAPRALLGSSNASAQSSNASAAPSLLGVSLYDYPLCTNATLASPHVDWSIKVLMADLSDFQCATVDVVLLFFIRSVALLGLALVACRVGTPDLNDVAASTAPGSCGCGAAACSSTHSGTATAPLLVNGAASSINAAASRGSDGASRAGGEAAPKPTTAVKAEHLESHTRKKLAEHKKNVAIWVMFAVSASAQVFVGVKCIGYLGGWQEEPSLMTVQGGLMAFGVLMINIEAFLLKRLINTATAEEGFLVPEFHPHRLRFRTNMSLHYCDLCRNKTKDVYRCHICDFDACPACFNKKDKATGEGILRSDKGIKQGADLTFGEYFKRALRLVLPHVPLLLLAIGCLAVSACISLFLPNYQGEIMDHVIDARAACTPGSPTAADCVPQTEAFSETIRDYLILSVVLGALGGLRSLSFMTVGRKIQVHIRSQLFSLIWQVHIRSQLFSRIIVQDIAFFDGMRTGDLTQRLSGDVFAMVQPLQYTLSTVLTNVILLFGGVGMCFYTSWRLSMLAFTTILPIMHITESYAKWSGKINREIFQHYSDGTAIATEAVSNIRTVRAVSSEAYETGKYDETMAMALRKGIKDGIFGSLSSAFNNYLDLGAGVLILWYGGSIAMRTDGSITVGSLIKYQLYWNMINNSMQSLNNVLNVFTRAAGAADRVLSLVDLSPDIDPSAGASADLAVRAWDVEFEAVQFRYQMRPLQARRENPFP